MKLADDPMAGAYNRAKNLRVLMAGLSSQGVCGVRDHAAMLSAALRTQGVHVETAWTTERGVSHPLTALANELAARCRQHRADVVVFHYSVFASSWHGIPLGIPVLAFRLWRLGVPVVLYAHELAYPWGLRGWKGRLHAVSQRLALVPLIAASSLVVVTTADRVRWVGACRWLPRRPIALAPVFSNIRPSTGASPVAEIDGRVGVFSFGAEGLAVDLVAQAMGRVARQTPSAHIALIGAPGPGSRAGQRWRDAAAAAGCPVVFTGVVEEAEVSRHLTACQLIVFPDPAGPTSRKTSLAAALAHGRPIVALDGPQRWKAVIAAGALVVVEPAADALADRIIDLLSDHAARVQLGAGARRFAEAHLCPARVAVTVRDAIQHAVDVKASKRAPCASSLNAGR